MAEAFGSTSLSRLEIPPPALHSWRGRRGARPSLAEAGAACAHPPFCSLAIYVGHRAPSSFGSTADTDLSCGLLDLSAIRRSSPDRSASGRATGVWLLRRAENRQLAGRDLAGEDYAPRHDEGSGHLRDGGGGGPGVRRTRATPWRLPWRATATPELPGHHGRHGRLGRRGYLTAAAARARPFGLHGAAWRQLRDSGSGSRQRQRLATRLRPRQRKDSDDDDGSSRRPPR
eukprot:COSAG06_NODE_3936_length_4747_cov_6.077238_2_plen_230_part_00